MRGRRYRTWAQPTLAAVVAAQDGKPGRDPVRWAALSGSAPPCASDWDLNFEDARASFPAVVRRPQASFSILTWLDEQDPDTIAALVPTIGWAGLRQWVDPVRGSVRQVRDAAWAALGAVVGTDPHRWATLTALEGEFTGTLGELLTTVTDITG